MCCFSWARWSGVISSALGLGGAFLIVPFLVVVYKLPMYVVPAATIPYAIVLSATGLIAYCVVLPLTGAAAIQPEWAWGFFAAAGGIFGSWVAAKTQLHVPSRFSTRCSARSPAPSGCCTWSTFSSPCRSGFEDLRLPPVPGPRGGDAGRRVPHQRLLVSLVSLVPPHGAPALKPLLLADEELDEERARAARMPRIPLSPREFGDLMMLGIGGFTPLRGFMTHADWEGACRSYRLSDGLFWPIPITLSADEATASGIGPGGEAALVEPVSGEVLATIKVAEKYRIDKAVECRAIFGTADPRHPGLRW